MVWVSLLYVYVSSTTGGRQSGRWARGFLPLSLWFSWVVCGRAWSRVVVEVWVQQCQTAICNNDLRKKLSRYSEAAMVIGYHIDHPPSSGIQLLKRQGPARRNADKDPERNKDLLLLHLLLLFSRPNDCRHCMCSARTHCGDCSD
jgi:hypothetical protein